MRNIHHQVCTSIIIRLMQYLLFEGDAITVTGDDVTLEQKNYNGKRAYGPKDLFVTEEHSEVADIAEHSELLE